MELLFTYITSGGIISTLVFIWLSIYFILTVWVWISRYLTLNKWESVEKKTLEILLHGSRNISKESILSRCLASASSYNTLAICKNVAEKKATASLSVLSVISSTAPFIGLFGTVVSILDTFAHIGKTSGGMSVIATGVADALIATAAGIFVAIFAYTYHQLLKRKSYETINLIQMQSESLLARSGE